MKLNKNLKVEYFCTKSLQYISDFHKQQKYSIGSTNYMNFNTLSNLLKLSKKYIYVYIKDWDTIIKTTIIN